MLKELPKEYTENLKYYKDTGYFTSSFTLNITMVFMDFFLDKASVEDIVRSLPQKGVSTEDVNTWKQAFKDYKEIEKKAEEFSNKCWSDINTKNVNEKSWTTFRFTSKNRTLLSMATAGRILITIRPEGLEEDVGEDFISLIGAEGSGKSCGLQGVYATKDEAIEFLDAIISNWNPENYCVYKNKNVGIC